jgi:hypothetical protein
VIGPDVPHVIKEAGLGFTAMVHRNIMAIANEIADDRWTDKVCTTND